MFTPPTLVRLQFGHEMLRCKTSSSSGSHATKNVDCGNGMRAADARRLGLVPPSVVELNVSSSSPPTRFTKYSGVIENNYGARCSCSILRISASVCWNFQESYNCGCCATQVSSALAGAGEYDSTIS